VGRDLYRPKFHFLPPAQWMNDPNGTIYFKKEFHIFFQFNPYGDKWGHPKTPILKDLQSRWGS
jgi:sucrose-6-phosphate hydrolase SacC (GH32 family)